jgi:hypothetical protein
MSTVGTPNFLTKIKERRVLILGSLIAFLTAPFGRVRLPDGVTTIIDSPLGNLILLVLIITGTVKVARKNPTGWIWGSAFFLYGSFSHSGITWWVYFLIASLGIWTYIKWTPITKEE